MLERARKPSRITRDGGAQIFFSCLSCWIESICCWLKAERLIHITEDDSSGLGLEVSQEDQCQEHPRGVYKAVLLQELIYNLPILAPRLEDEKSSTAAEFHYGNSTKYLLISGILWVCLFTGGTPFSSWGMTLFLLQPCCFPGATPKCASHLFHWLFKGVLCVVLRSWWGFFKNAYQKILTANSKDEKGLLQCHLFLRGRGKQNLQLNSYVLELLLFYKLF